MDWFKRLLGITSETSANPKVSGVQAGRDLRANIINVTVNNPAGPTMATATPTASSSNSTPTASLTRDARADTRKIVIDKLERKFKELKESGDPMPLSTIFRTHSSTLQDITSDSDQLAQRLHDDYVLSPKELAKVKLQELDCDKNKTIYDFAFKKGEVGNVGKLIQALYKCENYHVIARINEWI